MKQTKLPQPSSERIADAMWTYLAPALIKQGKKTETKPQTQTKPAS